MEDKIKQKIGELIGEASMCWSETPKGVFRSARASEIVDELYALLNRRTPPTDATAGEERRCRTCEQGMGGKYKRLKCGFSVKVERECRNSNKNHWKPRPTALTEKELNEEVVMGEKQSEEDSKRQKEGEMSDAIECRACGYTGTIDTFAPCMTSIYNDIRCPKCGSTNNEHNAEYQKQLQKSFTKPTAPAEDSGEQPDSLKVATMFVEIEDLQAALAEYKELTWKDDGKQAGRTIMRLRGELAEKEKDRKYLEDELADVEAELGRDLVGDDVCHSVAVQEMIAEKDKRIEKLEKRPSTLICDKLQAKLKSAEAVVDVTEEWVKNVGCTCMGVPPKCRRCKAVAALAKIDEEEKK